MNSIIQPINGVEGKNPGDIQVINGGKSRIKNFNRIKAKIKQKEKRGTT